MSFKLNNAYATYQRLIDVAFSYQIECNLEVYINNMVVKTLEERNHYDDL